MEAVKEFLLQLLRTPALYPAVLALVHAVLFWLVPAFPREIVTAGDALIAVVASVITGQQVQVARREAAAEKAAKVDLGKALGLAPKE